LNQRFHLARTFLLGFGFLGISLIWLIMDNYVPIFLQVNFMLSAWLTGFMMNGDDCWIMVAFGVIFILLAGACILRFQETARSPGCPDMAPVQP
jgi:hypothetical protein